MTRKKVLTIAGSDSGGGAGIQADIKTISAFGCYAASAITAVTVQNTLGVQAVHPVPADIVSGQITAVLDDIGADAIKIGMLFNTDIIHAVAQTLNFQLSTFNSTTPVVLDPVMVSTSGHRLMNEDAIESLTAELIPLATLITPNLPEAEVLLGEKITDLSSAAQALAEKYKVSVLLKAGHLVALRANDELNPLQANDELNPLQANDELTDILYDYKEKRTYTYSHSRVDTKNTHGTGCTLSSAIASQLAKGLPLNDAIGAAIQYLGNALLSAEKDVLGHGFGPVDHFFAQK